MHRKTRIHSAAGLGGLFVALALTATPAAAELYNDSHCFKNGTETASFADEQYARGEPMDQEQIEAVEELQENQWRLRSSNFPFRNALDHVARESPVWHALLVSGLERERRLNDSRTGSKYIYVNPEMKRLARLRSEIRNLKRKPCNPNMVYLGTR